MRQFKFHFIALALVFIALLVGCAKQQSTTYHYTAPKSLSLYPESVHYYLTMAKNYQDDEKVDYIIKAAGKMVEEGMKNEAKQMLANLPQDLLVDQQTEKHLILANIYLIEKRTTTAKQYLAKITPETLTTPHAYKYYDLLSKTYQQKNDWLNSSIALAKLCNYVPEEQKPYYHKQIVFNLSKLKTSSIYAQLLENNYPEIKPWLDLAHIYKKNLSSPTELEKQLVIWQNQYQTLVPYLPPFTKEQNIQSQKVALLLPVSGKYKQAGNAIKDGFMEALFKHKGKVKYNVKIYDTSTSDDMSQLYQQAIDDGTSLVIGPLIKENIENLLDHTPLKTPTILLNYSYKINNDDVYTFSINPSQEATQIAYFAHQRGYKRAFVIWFDNQWGQNSKKAFVKAWGNLNNTTVGEIAISENTKISSEIIDNFHITNSHYRNKYISSIFPKNQFFPKPRDDVDFIALMTNDKIALQLIPLLKFNYLGNIPIIATSLIYNSDKTTVDRDLHGITFCDMPVMLSKSIGKSTNNDRLEGIGYDSFLIISHLNILKNFPSFGLPGKSGHLYIDQNEITRALNWGTFYQSGIK